MGWSLADAQAKECDIRDTSVLRDRGRGSLLSHRGILPGEVAMFLLGNKCVFIEQLRRVEKGIPLMSIQASRRAGPRIIFPFNYISDLSHYLARLKICHLFSGVMTIGVYVKKKTCRRNLPVAKYVPELPTQTALRVWL